LVLMTLLRARKGPSGTTQSAVCHHCPENTPIQTWYADEDGDGFGNNEDSIEKIRNRYIDAEVTKQLDYPIFMAVSERGGKNNSGDYEYLLDDDGNLIEDAFGNPEIDQDLVNHSITRDHLINPDFDFEKADLNIAEAFVKFCKEQGFDFWKN